MSPHLPPPDQMLFSFAMEAVASRALHVVAELGVADLVGPEETVETTALATQLGTEPDSLRRLLRAVEPHGVFEGLGPCWAHTPASLLLRSDHPRSMRPFVRVIGLPLTWLGLTDLQASVHTGQPALAAHHPDGLFGYLDVHPDQRAVFDAAMTAKSHADIGAVLTQLDVGTAGTVLDVGAGVGHLVNALLDSNPGMLGHAFELPQVATGIPSRVDGRLTIHGGDFFVDPLPTADLTVLMQVIHDWDDRDARRILTNIGATARPGDRLVLLEGIIPDHAGPHPSKTLDLLMLACTGGRERTDREYGALLDAAGYDLSSITTLDTGIGAVDARRR